MDIDKSNGVAAYNKRGGLGCEEEEDRGIFAGEDASIGTGV